MIKTRDELVVGALDEIQDLLNGLYDSGDARLMRLYDITSTLKLMVASGATSAEVAGDL